MYKPTNKRNVYVSAYDKDIITLSVRIKTKWESVSRIARYNIQLQLLIIEVEISVLLHRLIVSYSWL